MTSGISQAEARRWRKRAIEAEKALNALRKSWSGLDYPGTYLASVNVASTQPDMIAFGMVKGTRKLEHAIVVIPKESPARFEFWACPVPRGEDDGA